MVDNKTLPLPPEAKQSPSVQAISCDCEDEEEDFPCNLISTMYKPGYEIMVPSFSHLIPHAQNWVIPEPRVTTDIQENICPLATVKALGFSEYDLMLSAQ